MPPIWKTVRVFISSTFRDMQAERDWLVKRVFPALRQRLGPYRIHLVDVDLRWGITREQAYHDEVLGLCLQQIDECRPFFLGLLGGRYGWVPATLPSEVAKRFGMTDDVTSRSITDLEIAHGVLDDRRTHDRAIFCFRSDAFLEDIHDDRERRIYIESPADDELRELTPEEALHRATGRRQLLADRKDQIRALSPPVLLFDGYPCTWNNVDAGDPAASRSGHIGGLEEFGRWIIESLERSILGAPGIQSHLAGVRADVHDELAEERDYHERFIESHSRVYVGQVRLQGELQAFVSGSETTPCLVTGRSGSGKSATLAEFCRLAAIDQPATTVVIPHFVGASPRSTGLREMLRRLCEEIFRRCRLFEQKQARLDALPNEADGKRDAVEREYEIPQDTTNLQRRFAEFLAKVPVDCRLVLVLDGLDQLDDMDNAHAVYWLPRDIPPQIRLIVSCLDDPDTSDARVLAAIRSRGPHTVTIASLNDEQRLEIIRTIPSIAAKTLDESQVSLLTANEATRNPLFLLVALEELRGFGSFEGLNERIAALPKTGGTLTAVFQHVIRRLGQDFDESTVKDVLTLLACARRGLSERELLDLIEGQRTDVESSASDLFPILRQLRPFLQSRGPVLDFFHRHLAMAVDETFFTPSDVVRLATHRRLAAYFHERVPFLESVDEQRARASRSPPTSRPANRRKVEELVHQRLAVLRLTSVGSSEFDAACEAVEDLLTDVPFLEAKAEAGFVFELGTDFGQVVAALPESRPRRQVLALLNEALRRHLHFVARHPTTLFQCLWNSFGDAGIAAREQTAAARAVGTLLSDLMMERRASRMPGVPWLRSRRRPAVPIGMGQAASFAGHVGTVRCIAISRDGTRLASGGDDRTIRIWDTASGVELLCLQGHDSEVEAVDFSPAGDRLASGGGMYDRSLRIWDLTTAAEVACIREHRRRVTSVRFSEDGDRIVTGSEDCTVRFWDAATGRCLQSSSAHRGPVNLVAVVPGTNLVLSAGAGTWNDGDASIQLWNVASGSHVRIVRDWSNLGHLADVAVAPDSRRCAVLGGDQHGTSVFVVDLAKGRQLSKFSVPPLNRSRLSWAPSGSLIAIAGGWDGYVRLWDAATGELRTGRRAHRRDPRSKRNTGTFSVAFSPDGESLFSAGDETILRWNIRAMDITMEEPEDHDESITGIAVCEVSNRIATIAHDRRLKIWDATGSLVRTMDVSGADQLFISNPVFSSDGTRLYLLVGGVLHVCALGRRVRWTRFDDREPGFYPFAIDMIQDRLALVPGEKALVSWGAVGHYVSLWGVRKRGLLRRFEGRHEGVDTTESIAVSPDGTLVAFGSDCTWSPGEGLFVPHANPKDRIRIVRLADGRVLQFLIGHELPVTSLAFFPGSAALASASLDGSVRVWSIETGRETLRLNAHRRGFVRVAVSADAHRIASCETRHERCVHVWDAATGALLGTRPGVADPAQFVDDRGRIAAAIDRNGQTALVKPVIDEDLAYFGSTFDHLVGSADGRVWAGALKEHLCIVALEGATASFRTST